jgi:xylulokinase
MAPVETTGCGVLGIDIGTSSVKALMLAPDGHSLAQASAAYAVVTDRPAQAESEPEDWWRATVSAVRQCVALADCRPAAVGLSGQMHGVVLSDGSGRAIRPAMLWSDLRAARHLAAYRALPEDMTSRLRNPLTPGMAGPMLLWLQANDPGAFAEARWALQPKDWLRLRLTGNAAGDPSDASATLLFDVAADTWHERLVDALGLDRSMLPDLLPSAEAAGTLTSAAGEALGLAPGTSVVTGAADTAAGIIGAGVKPGALHVSMGTGLQVIALRSEPTTPESPAVHLYRTAEARGWYAMGATLNGGNVLDWVRRMLGADWSDVYGAAANSGTDDDPIFLPHLVGERTPHLDTDLRGAWTGLAMNTDRNALLRSALEGVAFALREAVDALEASQDDDVRRARVHISGGGSTSAVWRQMLADALDREVVLSPTPAASSRGAALLAARYAGLPAATEDQPHLDDQGVCTGYQRTSPRPSEVARLAGRHVRFATTMCAVRDGRQKPPLKPPAPILTGAFAPRDTIQTSQGG